MHHWALRLVARHGGNLSLLVALLLLWYALTGGRDWVFGAVAAVLAAVVARSLGGGTAMRLSLPGVLRFVLYFLQRSIEGGIDVAWRVFHRHLPLVVREDWRPLDLHGPPRTLYLVTACLLPGTLACEHADGQVYVHSISADAGGKLEELEARVRAVFQPPRRRDAGS